MKNQPKCLKVCPTCPWIRQNHGKKHPAKWYSLANLKRLWNGVRTGKAPGMVCHSTDPESPEYGGTNPNIKPGAEHECAGLIQIVIKQVDSVNESKTFKEYQAKHKFPFTRTGLR